MRNINHEKRTLLSNFFSLSVLQVATYVLPLITFPYLVRVLGVEKFGLVMFAQAFMVFFVMFTDFGFNLSATKEVALHRKSATKLTEIFSSVMQIKAVLLVIAFVVLCGIVFVFPAFREDATLYLVSFLFVVSQMMFPQWYFQGLEKMHFITIVNIVSRLFFTFLVFVFVQSPQDYLMPPLLNGLGGIFGGIVSLWIVRSKFGQTFRWQRMEVVRRYFYESAQFFLSRVSVSAYTSANAFVLGLFVGHAAVGYYSIAEKLYIAMQQLFQPLVQSLYPYIAHYKNVRLFTKVFVVVVTLNTFASIVLYLYGEWVFALLFGAEASVESLEVFGILLVANVIVVPSIMIGYPFLGALGYADIANKSVIYASLVHMAGLGMLFYLDNISIYSVAYMVVVTQSADLLYRVYGVVKYRLFMYGKDERCAE